MGSEEGSVASNGPRRGVAGSFSWILCHYLLLCIIPSPKCMDVVNYGDSGQVEETPLPPRDLIIYFPEAQ